MSIEVTLDPWCGTLMPRRVMPMKNRSSDVIVTWSNLQCFSQVIRKCHAVSHASDYLGSKLWSFAWPSAYSFTSLCMNEHSSRISASACLPTSTISFPPASFLFPDLTSLGLSLCEPATFYLAASLKSASPYGVYFLRLCFLSHFLSSAYSWAKLSYGIPRAI